MIKFPLALAQDLLDIAESRLEKADSGTEGHLTIETLCAEIQRLVDLSIPDYPHPDLGYKCFEMNTFLRYLEFDRIEICMPVSVHKPSFSIQETLELIVSKPRHLRLLFLNELEIEEHDIHIICSKLSRLTRVRHLIVQNINYLGASFFKALQEISIGKLELQDLELSQGAADSFFVDLSEYLGSNPPLQKLIVRGWCHTGENSHQKQKSRTLTSKLEESMESYEKDRDLETERSKYKQFLDEIGREHDDGIEIDTEEHLTIFLTALLKNTRLEVLYIVPFIRFTNRCSPLKSTCLYRSLLDACILSQRTIVSSISSSIA